MEAACYVKLWHRRPKLYASVDFQLIYCTVNICGLYMDLIKNFYGLFMNPYNVAWLSLSEPCLVPNSHVSLGESFLVLGTRHGRVFNVFAVHDFESCDKDGIVWRWLETLPLSVLRC